MMSFEITEKDFKEAEQRYIDTLNPLVLKVFPAKEKKKYVLLTYIIKLFKKGIQYTEKEINEILKPVYEDYVIIRRYLVDYDFLDRLDNGKAYWVKEKKG
ncbi:hypothetical protein BK011_06110 [Tenericutes bacterium MZ-XQ]|jgi:hypothetical protein|nr:hypothetical protein BK011_06110 [Tenericutes bacterium MZ-XQ]